MKTYIEIKIIDKDGKVVKEAKSEANSLVRNFIRALYGLMTAAQASFNVITLTDITGATFGYPNLAAGGYPIFNVGAGSGETRFGIVVGSGTSPVSYTDFRLASLIPHGTGSGQLFYSNTEYALLTLPDGTHVISFTRTFTNQSPGDVTINEVGLGFHVTVPGPTSRYVLIERTVLSSPITLSPNQSAVIRYVFSVG
ncbi:MAG: hypothetical protein QXQ91_03515 [Nanopusillaceae archaeon]